MDEKAWMGTLGNLENRLNSHDFNYNLIHRISSMIKRVEQEQYNYEVTDQSITQMQAYPSIPSPLLQSAKMMLHSMTFDNQIRQF